MKRALFVIIFLYGICFKTQAQVSIKDSSVYVPLVVVGYGHYLPGGDMVARFSNNSSLFLQADFKLINYWIFGVTGNYLFGKTVKEHLFDSIAKDNIIINDEGDFADIRLYERGFTVAVSMGRMIVLTKKRPNCGVVINAGVGFIQHKIRIEVIGNNVPQ